MEAMEDLLTKEELSFLSRLGLGPNDVMDVRGLPQRYWFREIERQEKTVALGNGCRAAGHRLKSRRSHCIQCSTRHLGYQRNYISDKYIYIAGSVKRRLVKIGNSDDWAVREYKLNYERYGSASDWKIIYLVRSKRAGEMEDRARARLRSHVVAEYYWKDGSEQLGIELLKCTFAEARTAIEEVLGDAKLSEPWTSAYAGRYDFSQDTV